MVPRRPPPAAAVVAVLERQRRRTPPVAARSPRSSSSTMRSARMLVSPCQSRARRCRCRAAAGCRTRAPRRWRRRGWALSSSAGVRAGPAPSRAEAGCITLETSPVAVMVLAVEADRDGRRPRSAGRCRSRAAGSCPRARSSTSRSLGRPGSGPRRPRRASCRPRTRASPVNVARVDARRWSPGPPSSVRDRADPRRRRRRSVPPSRNSTCCSKRIEVSPAPGAPSPVSSTDRIVRAGASPVAGSVTTTPLAARPGSSRRRRGRARCR